MCKINTLITEVAKGNLKFLVVCFVYLLAFCRDRDVNCKTWKSLGMCEDPNPKQQLTMAIYCGITCDTCK